MSAGVDQVVAHFNEIVKPDGGSVKVLDRQGDTLRVAYNPGSNDECASCVIPGADLANMMQELVREQDASISEVVVVEEA
jgi:Fe-S cluster biogenesis protein NfuA